MRHPVLLLLLFMAAASPAAAQSCATLSGRLDCRGAPTGQPAKSPPPAQAGQAADVQGYAETTISNRGASATIDNRVIDSHGIMEFGISGSTGRPCRYGPSC